MRKKNEVVKEPEIVVGLDIGTTKIATIIGMLNAEGKIDILAYGNGESTGVQHGLIYNIIKTVEGINFSKSVALSRFHCNVDEVIAGVAGRHIKSIEYKHNIIRRKNKEETITQEEVDEMTEDLKRLSVTPGEQIIDVIPQRFIIDRQREEIDPVGCMGEVIDGFFQIITGNEAEIRKIILCLNKADLKVKSIILEPIASGLACLTVEEKQQGVVMVDIGGGTTDVAVFLNGKPVFTRVIPVGGVAVTKDIATICQISEELAEKLKTSYGTCVVDKSNKNNLITIPQLTAIEPKQISETYLAEIIYARIAQDILKEVARAIKESGYAAQVRCGIVLTGGGAAMKNIKELCEFITTKPVRIGCPGVGFASSTYSELKNPKFSTVMGLLKYGILGYAENAVEIPPPPSPPPPPGSD
ncbi:MAG: cell division protein FtsA, partial [Bacteroidales bacterium]|nr:cell division protein FtsA [Bacteroidales bacterium]